MVTGLVTGLLQDQVGVDETRRVFHFIELLSVLERLTSVLQFPLILDQIVLARRMPEELELITCHYTTNSKSNVIKAERLHLLR